MAVSNKKKPNILWIGVDQLRYDTVGANGNKTCLTPNIDRIAEEGVNFSNAYSPCSLCSPSRASMLTGVYAFKHGMGTNCDMYIPLSSELNDPDMLLHKRLQEFHYHLGWVGKSHIGTKKSPADYGFEGVNLPGYGGIRNYPGFKEYLNNNNLTFTAKNTIFANANNNTPIGGLWDGPTESTPAHYLANCTIDLIEKFSKDEHPFFLTCQFWGPHLPYLPSREFHGIHDRNQLEPWPNFNDDLSNKATHMARTRDSHYRMRPTDWEGWKEIVGLYYDFTSMIDFEIGRILDDLKKNNRADDTIVIFTTDHGDMTGSHGQSYDKGNLYEEAHHIPMMVSWPKHFKQEHTCTDLVSNMDIFPTILDIVGIPDEDLHGKSFLRQLEGKKNDQKREELLLEFHGLRYLYSQRAMITEDGWKYLFIPGDWDELYNLKDDPFEMTNLINSKELGEHIEQIRDRFIDLLIREDDPIRDCMCKFFDRWDKTSGKSDTVYGK